MGAFMEVLLGVFYFANLTIKIKFLRRVGRRITFSRDF